MAPHGGIGLVLTRPLPSLLSDRASRAFIGPDPIPLPALLVHNPKILNSYGGVANGRLEVERCVALDIVRYMVAVFLGREPLARVNTQPIALDARLALHPCHDQQFPSAA